MTSHIRAPHVSPVPRPDEITELHELRTAIDQMLGSITPREAMTVRRYYGFEGDGCTYAELGRQMGISDSRVKQIINKALRKLRHPSRCRILRPHVEICRDLERAAKEDNEAERVEQAARLAKALQDAQERRARDDRRRRIGEEIGSSSSWRSDCRRRAIAEALDRVTNEVVTKVRSTDEIYSYFRDHFHGFWRIYDAWKRDVRRRICDNNVTFTCGVTADGSYLIYARKDRHAWYLFEIGCGYGFYSSSEYRWVGYDVCAAMDGTMDRRRHLRALDQPMTLKISRSSPHNQREP